ncbi:hypothetical protein AB0I72_10625 [Nocardiopsis sp. NPDC049922]|uniref:hypothetical protein n=1 Tax=Nocardiopsis sp. NPDC049922 TaxID=3155157 RepID=UPI0033F6D8F8
MTRTPHPTGLRRSEARRLERRRQRLLQAAIACSLGVLAMSGVLVVVLVSQRPAETGEDDRQRMGQAQELPSGGPPGLDDPPSDSSSEPSASPSDGGTDEETGADPPPPASPEESPSESPSAPSEEESEPRPEPGPERAPVPEPEPEPEPAPEPEPEPEPEPTEEPPVPWWPW